MAGKLTAPAKSRIPPGTPGGTAGTNGAPIRPSGGSSGTNGWRSEWEVFAIFLVIAVAVALTNVFTQLADYEENGITLPA